MTREQEKAQEAISLLESGHSLRGTLRAGELELTAEAWPWPPAPRKIARVWTVNPDGSSVDPENTYRNLEELERELEAAGEPTG